MAAKTKKAEITKKTGIRKRTYTSRKSGNNAPAMVQEDNTAPLKRKKYSYKYLILGVFVILLLSALYLLKGYFVAAMVNGKPITRLELIKQLEQSSGKAALDNLVTKEMILQEAKKQNVNVTGEEVSAELDKLTKQLEAEGTTLDAALAVRGMERNSFEENLRVQKLVEKLLENDINVSDEETQKYFEENKAMMGENAKYEDLKEDLKLQLRQQKLDVEYEKLYNKLKAESDVKYFVTF